MGSKIKAISYYLPEKVYSNKDLEAEFPEWSASKVLSKTGILERRIANTNETSLDLAYNSTVLLFKEHSIDKNSIEFILFCTQSPDYFLPTSACILQDRLGIPKTTGALDFNLGCSGYVYGLSLAKGLIESGTVNNVLLITSETYSKFINLKDKKNRSIFGDAAASTFIEKSETNGIGAFVFGTDGNGANNLIVKRGAFRNREFKNDVIIDDEGDIVDDNSLFMNGTAIFNFTLREIPKSYKIVLQKNRLSENDIHLFVFHQANDFILESIRRKLKIPPEKFQKYFHKVGNTVSASIPIALSEGLRAGKVNYGHKIMLIGFGVGLSWASVIIEL